MSIRAQLLTIAKLLGALPRTKLPFLSIYLDTAWDDEMQRDRVRIFLKNEFTKIKSSLSKEAQVQASFKHDAAKIEDYVFGVLPDNTKGLVVFACHGENIFNPFPLPVQFIPRVVSTDRPYIRPLVRAVDENKTALVARLHADQGEIYEISFGDMDWTYILESEVPKKVMAGGWSQMRYQRHTEARVRDHLTEIAKRLIKISDQEKIKYVYLFGPETLTAKFQEKLPKRLRLSVQMETEPKSNASKEDLKMRVATLLTKQERLEEKQKLKKLAEMAQAGDKAVIGLEQTLVAINQAAVQELMISDSYTERGWECSHCFTLGKSLRDQCPNCEHPLIQVPHLGNALVAKVLIQDGKIEEIIDNEEWDRAGGIGAFIRFQPQNL